MILHVTKDTYEQLGLEGKPSAFSFHKPTKYGTEYNVIFVAWYLSNNYV